MADWKAGHKLACRLPQERAADADTIVVRVGRPDPVLEASGARYLVTWSHHESSGQVQKQLKSSNAGRYDMFQPLVVPAGEGNVFISKIQTPPMMGQPMMIYDKGKNFQTMIHPGNTTPESYQRIFRLIQSGGQANGRKGYFSTAIQAGGTELHVFASSLLPAQSW